MLTYNGQGQQQAYADLLVDLISRAEGHIAMATDLGDGARTIGYGYTFGRTDNLALWKAAGIVLTPADELVLKNIDQAQSLAAKNQIVDQQFARNLSRDEAKNLLAETYGSYEGPAIQLGMPVSRERAALVSLSYNRGVVNLEARMPGFYRAIRNQDRAEAWFELRYNSWGTAQSFEAGLRARRLVEAQVFGLYDTGGAISSDESKHNTEGSGLHNTEGSGLDS